MTQNIEQEVLNLELTVTEVNVILRTLGKHPFDEVAALVSKIKGQGEAQIAEIVEAAKAAAPAEETPAA